MKRFHPLASNELLTQSGSVDIQKIMPMIRNELRPNSVLITADLILTSLVFYCLLFFATTTTSFTTFLLAAIVGGFALFRGLVFVHECYHLKGQMPYLTPLYNICIGYFNKMPAYVYTPHEFHHKVKTYGTVLDPEYEAISRNPRRSLALLPAVLLIAPTFYLIRHGILPLFYPFLSSKVTAALFDRHSTFAMNPKFSRGSPSPSELAEMKREDSFCLAFTIIPILACGAGLMPWQFFLAWGAMFYVFFLANYYRVIVSHRYFGSDLPMSYKEQILDSVTVEGSRLTNFIFFPLGLNYHTLHHLIPQAPAHSLRSIHQKLMIILPADHPYRLTTYSSYSLAVRDLLLRMRDRGSNDSKVSSEPPKTEISA